MADVVPIQHKASQPHRMQLVIDQVGDRALAAGAQPGEPNHTAPMAIELLAFLTADTVGMPMEMDFFVVHFWEDSSLKKRAAKDCRGSIAAHCRWLGEILDRPSIIAEALAAEKSGCKARFGVNRLLIAFART
jgi:hypothetical protein